MFNRFISIAVLLAFSFLTVARAASRFAGFYTGQIYQTISGSVSVSERPIGGVAFTISESGAISSSSDLSGTVTDSGSITWNANSTGFTDGQVANGVISATTSINNNGTVSTFRIEAKNTGPGIGESNVLANRFFQVNPTQALRNMNRVRFAGDRFVAVGASGAFAVSYDGVNWTRSGAPTILALYDVAYGNGRYVVVGDSGARFWSTNGVDWVANPAGNGPVAAVAFGNGKFAVMTFTGGVSLSEDGVAWSGGASLSGGLVYSGLDFVNGEFAAWTGNQIAFSPDASDWTKKVGFPNIGNITVNLAIHNKIAYGNGIYVLAGQQGLALSANGTSWTKASKAPGVLFGDCASVVFGDGKFVVCDTADNLWTSTDGQQWTRVDQIELHSMAYGNGRFVGVGDNTWNSADGAVWVLPQQDQLRADYRESSFVDLLSVSDVVGVFAEDSTARYSYGRNGTISWYKHQFADGSGVARQLTSETLRAAMNIRLGEAPVIVGNRGAMIVAEDRQGVTFKLVPPVTSADLLHGAKGADTLVFVGTGGTIIYTKDVVQRTNWFAATSGTGETLKHVAWYPQEQTSQPGVFIVTGEKGTLLTSPDGSSWTRRNSGLSVDLAGSAYERDTKRLLAATADGRLLQSTDNGVTWTVTTPLPTAGTLRYFRNTDPNFKTYGIIGGGDHGLVVTLVPATADVPQAGKFTMGSPAAFYSSRLNAITQGNGRFAVAGDKISGVSLDGQTWRGRTNGFEALGIAFGNGRFVAVGSGRIIGTSGDALRWELRTNVLARDFRAILFAGDRFVAVGSNGAIGVSEDGINWTDRSISSSVTYNDITWNAGTFIAAGTSGTVLISTNQGTSWIEKPTFIPEIKGITFGNGRYVVVAGNGYSASSSNGLEWQLKQYPYISPVENRPDFSEVGFSDGTFFAPSTRGEIYASADGLTWKRNFTGVGLELKGALVANGAMMFIANNEIYRLNVPDAGTPIITKNPVGTTVDEDGSVTLTGVATGPNSASMHYAWLKDGAPVEGGPRFSGADGPSLTISPFLLEDGGSYEFVAVNEFGSRASAAAVVNVNPKATIATQPESSVEALGTKATLSVEATGQNLFYQWFKDGAAIAGANSATFEIAALTAQDAGDYYVEVTNPVGIKVSQHAALSVVSLPAGYTMDPSWPSPDVTATFLSAVAFQPDGKFIMFGAINVKGAVKNLVRLNADGTVDTTFNADNPDNQVRAIYPLADGKILIGGFFSKVGTFARPTLARLNADGKVDTSYNPGITSIAGIYRFEPRADGKIWVGGSFTQFGQKPTIRYLGLLNGDGTPDTTYSSVIGDYVLAIHQYGDGGLLVGGGGNGGKMLNKLLPTGKLDNSFPVGGSGPSAFGGQFSSPNVSAILPAPDGKFYIGGIFTHYNATPRPHLARILPNGELDSTFTNLMDNFSTGVKGLAYLGDKLLVGGDFYAYAGNTNNRYLVLVDQTGAVAPAPQLPKLNGFQAMFVRENNSLVLVGGILTSDGKQKAVARFTEGGGAELGLGIVRQPQSLTVKPGRPATLAVAATGKGTLTFQWRKNGEPLAGETRPTLVIAAAASGNAGTYSVEVKDSAGTMLSEDAVLSVGDTSSAGGFAEWAAALALPAGKNGLLDDADGDGSSNAAEYAFGTNPLQPGSKPQLEQKAIPAGGQSYPAVSYIRNKSATGVAIRIRASDSVIFQSVASTVEVTPAENLGNGLERVTVRSATATPHTFFFEVKTSGN